MGSGRSAPILVDGGHDVSEAGAIPARLMRAVVFACVALTLLLLLRAKSDGASPPLAVLLASFGFVVASGWVLGSRERGAIALLIALVATELALHVGYLFASTGQLAHPGGAGLFCSPASISGAACTPTDRGGLLLLAVQLTVGLALAFVMRGADAECWQLLRRPTLAAATIVRRLLAALAALPALAALSAAGSLAPVQRLTRAATTWVSPHAPRRLMLSHDCGRRGPPADHHVTLSMVTAPAFS